MSGHSKWSTIKRAKGITDAKRGAVFTKLGNIITVSVREKGSDPTTNFGLRMAITKAKAANMPKDNIERAIKRGAGELVGEQINELIYEGIGPKKIQFIVKCLTDNKNRTAAHVRHIFSKYDGSLGAVVWNFIKQGVIRIDVLDWQEKSDLELELIDHGVQDIEKNSENIILYTNVEELQKVNNFLDSKDIEIKSSEIEYTAKEKKEITEEEMEVVNNFVEELEDCEDVNDYYSNMV